jgi:hypothetical protein
MSSRADLAAQLDADLLIPGDIDGLNASAEALDGLGRGLGEAASAMARIEVADWDGPAADAFHWIFDPEPKRWVRASDVMADAADYLRRFVAELRVARGKAAEARTLWQQGIVASEGAANDTGPASPAVAERNAVDSIDPGDAKRNQAVMLLDSARAAVTVAGGVAAVGIGWLANDAPEKGMLDHVSDFGDGIHDHVLVPGVNGVVALGQAIAENPGSSAEVVGGAALMALGATGEVGGGGLTLSGVGAPLGIPLVGASTALIGAGGALAGHGAIKIGQDALDNNPNVLQAKKGQMSPHEARMTVVRDGKVVADKNLTSANMTPEEKALGFPKSMLAAHTEARGLRGMESELRPGDKVVFEGYNSPCAPCKGIMNRVSRETGADIEYVWKGQAWKATK